MIQHGCTQGTNLANWKQWDWRTKRWQITVLLVLVLFVLSGIHHHHHHHQLLLLLLHLLLLLLLALTSMPTFLTNSADSLWFSASLSSFPAENWGWPRTRSWLQELAESDGKTSSDQQNLVNGLVITVPKSYYLEQLSQKTASVVSIIYRSIKSIMDELKIWYHRLPVWWFLNRWWLQRVRAVIVVRFFQTESTIPVLHLARITFQNTGFLFQYNIRYFILFLM